jgi:galactofuranosylgalactofuranosylrhamnosyl-N-acetylglucosaminyl-diphospho-decaprenol beta-1,5/1,6-galactofuranosyltransferase
MSTVLQHVVFPDQGDPDLLPLYADPETWTRADDDPLRLSAVSSIDNVLSRDSARVRAGSRVSYGTYFNGFPASYWQRWTVVREVTLTLKTRGRGTVLVYRSNSGGQQQRVEWAQLADEQSVSFTLPLNVFGDGGWYWFDLIAGEDDLELLSGAWSTAEKPVTTGKLSLGMTTFNKPDYCVQTLENIASNSALTEVIDQILLVDQGTKKVADQTGYDDVSTKLGAKLRVINQPNIGGSGGFSRAMAETLELDDTDFLLLLDDDIEFETESALRALQFGRFSREPVIVGGHMFDLLDKPVIHAWAEIVSDEAFNWGPSFPEQHRHDFRESNLRQTPWMHARLDSDYNGWWMCMIPKKIIQEIGLSVPLFIKWDDAEYGLRARNAGYRTVSLPGVALWHVSWLDKDDTQDWQAFFHTRNRVIAGLLHARAPKGGRLLENSGRQDIKKLLNMQYYAVQLAVDGLRAVLEGPEKLHSTIHTAMPLARTKARDYPETKVYRPGDDDLPTARGGRALPLLGDPEAGRPEGARLGAFVLRQWPKHWKRSAAERDEMQPELEYAKRDAKWWIIPNHQSVIIGTADGSGKSWYRHDQSKFRRLWKESRRLTREIEKNWDDLARRYQEALPKITSVDEWKKTFGITDDTSS